ncbi:penicillin acylase family protein [Solirubrobacter sp. CPCC 204708]|uniref:Penicillin acylase family protein n=1 Tax=Solirubrobacter deserti TaxID=2282478 RepID=A0ABT4RQ74_9ACTN|nr:penicillin acylase family protein [Solirubrobacter deserti]MBE2318291.1 penicillin acylase family protein [Solirubrobacter deserti]MDA0140630.1 penicillin acylase family protein [Solirubrobacter deserti]
MSRTVALAAVTFALAAAPAAADDYAAVARNIIASGQYGSAPPPPGAEEQALMYDALTPLFDQVTNDDLMTKFKSAGFGVGPDGPARPEPLPRAGVTVVRDRFNVPHITGRSRDDVTWAMGWLLQQDRGLLLAQARDAAKLAALDAPNVYAFGLVINLRQYKPTPEVDRIIERNGLRALREAGAAGRAVLHDVDVYLQGINARLRAEGSTARPWRRADVFAANAVIGEIFGEGGGDEARRSQFLSALRREYGTARGNRMFEDFTSFDDRDAPTTMTRTFRYGTENLDGPGNVVLDAGSFKPTGPRGLASAANVPQWASNFLLVSGRRSATGHPLFVAGPQIGYTYPGLTLEADISWPGGQARGATAPGFAGNILIGRGQDYAWSLTSAGSDVVDTYVETLCGGSRTKYRYKGRCRTMGRVDAGTVTGFGRIAYRTTVHGPVTGYAKVNGRTVAISRKRASFGQDILWQLGFRDLTTGKVRSKGTFRAAMASSPFTFNVGYADDQDIAMYSAGRLPVRPRSVDPRLPVKGTGEYEWRGFLAQSRRPYQANPPSGALVNWNNRPAPGWGAADDNWSYGATQRVRMLDEGLARRGVHDLASVTGAMNAAATQDLRSVALTPVIEKLLRAHPAGATPRASRMLELLVAWRAAGSSRLDREPDGVMDAGPGPAIWDAFYPRLWAAAMPVKGLQDFVGTNSGPASGFTGGGFWYLEKDLGRLTGTRWKSPFKERYCGGGDAARCAAAVWKALDAVPGDPDALRADANAERIAFRPGLLPTTIRYTNRPSGIQQVISFGGGRR